MDLWFADLRATAGAAAFCERLLSRQELARASRFCFTRDRSRFVIAHGVTRLILAEYLRVPPATITIDHLPNGKPFLPGIDLSFSISHSHRLLCCALSGGVPIGVDVERVRKIDHMRIAQRFLAPEEQAELREAEVRGEGRDRFYRIWTLKEAVLKATGAGLRVGLGSSAVTAAGTAPRLVRLNGDSEESGAWSLRQFRPGGRYVGAVAARGVVGRIVCRILNVTAAASPGQLS